MATGTERGGTAPVATPRSELFGRLCLPRRSFLAKAGETATKELASDTDALQYSADVQIYIQGDWGRFSRGGHRRSDIAYQLDLVPALEPELVLRKSFRRNGI